MTLTADTIIAVLALLLSGYATWRSHRFKKKEEELLDVQGKVNLLLLEKEQREAKQAVTADFGANFVALGRGNYRLKVFNKGKAVAYQVDIEFPEGNDVIPERELRSKFPMEVMEPGQAVELIAAVHTQTKRKQPIHLKWKNSGGMEQEKTVHATL